MLNTLASYVMTNFEKNYYITSYVSCNFTSPVIKSSFFNEIQKNFVRNTL